MKILKRSWFVILCIYCSYTFGQQNTSDLLMVLPDTHMLEEGGSIECSASQIKDDRGYCVDVAPSCGSGEEWIGGMSGGRCVQTSVCGPDEVEISMGGKDGVICKALLNQNPLEDCDSTYDFIIDPEGHSSCERRNTVERDRAEAERLAKQEADSLLPGAINERVSTLSDQCRSAAAPVFQNCMSMAEVDQVADFSGANTAQACNALKANTEATINGVTSQMNSCVASRETIQTSCPSITGEVRVVGEATVGGQTARAVSVGSDRISENVSIKDRANGIIESLAQDISAANTELSRISSEAQACIARIEEQEFDESVYAGHNNDGNGFSGDTDGEYSATDKDTTHTPPGTDSSELSSTKSGGGNPWGNLLGVAAGVAAGSMGAGESEVPTPSDDGGYSYKPYNLDDSTLGSGGGSPSLGGGAPYDQNGTSFNKRPDPFIPTKDATGPENPDGDNATLAGGPRASGGAGGGFAGMPPDANGSRAANGRSGRRNGLAKARQMISGHKRTKQNTTGNGRSGIRGRLSPQAMKLAYEKAVKKFGRKVPLKFDGSKYIPDLLAMKNSRNFKMRNARAIAMYKGEKVEKEMTLDEILLEKQINPNAKHGIFRTMNIYFRRNFEKASQANGLKL